MKNIWVDTPYNRVGTMLVWTYLNPVFLVRSDLCLASTDSVELFYMLYSILSEVYLPEQSPEFQRKYLEFHTRTCTPDSSPQSLCDFFSVYTSFFLFWNLSSTWSFNQFFVLTRYAGTCKGRKRKKKRQWNNKTLNTEPR